MNDYANFFTELENQLKGLDKQEKFNLLIKTGHGRSEKLHSNLISDFLKLNKRYFGLFLEQIGLEPDFIEFKDAKIYREIPAGGFVDIFIRYKNRIIIIENKVDDQGKSGQLQKYCEALKLEFDEIHTHPFYLTKYGELPPNDRDCEHKCLSYEKDIVKWLEKCIKETTDPTDNRIKESLEIYVELVRKVINRDKYMEEVFDYLRNDKEKMSLAIDIYKTLNGRNFFEDTDIRDRIKEMIQDCLDVNKIVFDDWEEIENDKNNCSLLIYDGDRAKQIGDFYFHFNEIYAAFPDNVIVPESHIIGRDLANDTLKAFLINNEEKVYFYITKCVDAMLNYTKK